VREPVETQPVPASSRWWLLPITLFSAVATVVMARLVFPNGSVNDDEAIYRLQAHTIASGHLFPAAGNPPQAFVPWLAAIRGHHYVLKYTPVEAAWLAASHVLTGSYLPALVVTVVALVVATWLLALELLGNEKEALIAAALVATSPLVIVQSGLLLAYLTTLVLLVLFVWTLVRGVRRGRPGWLIGAGLSIGVAGAIRPYDAVIFAAPFAVWAVRELGWGRRILSAAGWVIVGGLGPLAAFLGYNDLATGSPTKLPFNLQDGHDTIGFGLRRLTPGEDFHHFGPIQGVHGVVVHLVAFLIWVAGGPLLIALAWLAVRRGRLQGPAVALAATAITLPLGYVYFWGPWNAGTIWGGIWLVGPFYLLPLVPVVAVLGARGITMWAAEHPKTVRRGLAAMVVLTIVVTAPVIYDDARYSRQDGQIVQLIRSVPGRTLIVLPDNPGFVMFPHSNVGNLGQPDDRALFVAQSGTASDFALFQQYGDRVPYLLYFSGAFLPHRAHLGVQLSNIAAVTQPQFELRVEASAERLKMKKLALTVTTGGSRIDCGPADAGGGWWLHVDPSGSIACHGAGPTISIPAGTKGTIGLRYLPKSGARDQLDLPMQVTPGAITLLMPGSVAALLRNVTLPMTVTVYPGS
jgi:4-amino-4-deoxy-L-arabinose transferase-like glycosyltransferase